MTRPRGEIRAALGQAAEQLCPAGADSGVTWREIAAAAQVGFSAARMVVKDMARFGELERVGQRAVPSANRPMTLFRPRRGFVHGSPMADLDSALRGWR